MSARTWADQPAELEGYDVLCVLHINGRCCEVRHHQGRYFPQVAVTVGNLFASRTVRCVSYPVALELLGALADLEPGARMTLPQGCSFMDSSPANQAEKQDR